MKQFSHLGRGLLLAASAALWLAPQAGRAQSLDLVAAYRQALQYDPTIQAAGQALAAGRELAVQGDALLKPRINLQAGVTRIHEHMDSELPGPAAGLLPSDSSGTARQATVQLVQPLYRQGARATRRQLHEQSALAGTRYDGEREQLVLRVAEVYLGVVVAQESLRVEQSELAAVSQQRDRAQARFDVGHGKITEVHEAQARLDAVQARLLTAQSQLELSQAQFRETVGSTPRQLAPMADGFAPRLPEPASLAAWQARGEAGNTLVRSQRSALDIAGAELDKNSLKARPTIDLVAGYGAKNQSGGLSALVAPNGERNASIGLQLNVPLYAGGGLDSRQREAVARRAEAELQLSAARRDVRLKVQEGYLAVTTGVARVAALEQALVSARSALQATTLGRDVGTRTALDVLDAQQRLASAERELVQARADYLLGRLRLAAAAGELSEESLRALGPWFAS
ncbi:TolC family outer membrane protein [Rugamonas sp. A1-17]|nr:TolC family outer membrane protein [Rugamonas sp. A1-17]